MLNGKILVVFNKLKNNYKKWFCSQSNIPKNSWNSVCNHQKVFYSMVHQVVVRLSWPKQLQMNVAPILFRSKVLNFWQCGLVKVRQMFETFLIKLELPLHVFYSSTNWTQLLLQEDLHLEMLEEQVIELLINYLPKWMVLEQRKTYSLLVLQIDLKF